MTRMIKDHVMLALENVKEVREDFRAKKIGPNDVLASAKNDSLVIGAWVAEARHRELDKGAPRGKPVRAKGR